MQWQGEGIIVQTRPHGETSLIVDLFTREKGRTGGMVRGGRSKSKRALHQLGHKVQAVWRGRLEEHLGHFQLDLLKSYSAPILNEPKPLAALMSLCALASLLPQNDPHSTLYDGMVIVLDQLEEAHIWPVLYIRWELEFLKELGFGLDLSQCADTGQTHDLIYVSPKSGKAVSEASGAPYKDRLLPLPPFLRAGFFEGTDDGEQQASETKTVRNDDIAAGLLLTGYFLKKYIFTPRGLVFPESRQRLEGSF